MVKLLERSLGLQEDLGSIPTLFKCFALHEYKVVGIELDLDLLNDALASSKVDGNKSQFRHLWANMEVSLRFRTK